MRYLLAFFFIFPAFAQQQKVDVALVLAVDISYSMDLDEQRFQREGYYDALLSPDIQAAISKGLHGRIAVSYVEWAGTRDIHIVSDWKIIDSAASAITFVDHLKANPPKRARRTSISGGIDKSLEMLEKLPYFAERMVIDVSGDGANNDGRPVEQLRDSAVRRGITINGLPVMVKAPQLGWADIEELDLYYIDCVIGGPGAFMIPIKSQTEFSRATKQKMIMEVSGVTPSFDYGGVETIKVDRPKMDCMIGEKMWQKRWGERY
jgi:Protein of unknown function (DUF1194)